MMKNEFFGVIDFCSIYHSYNDGLYEVVNKHILGKIAHVLPTLNLMLGHLLKMHTKWYFYLKSYK